MIIFFDPPLWQTVVFLLIGYATDRLVVARLGITLERLSDWFLFGAAHWFWPLWLLALAVHESPPVWRTLRRWVHVALWGWST